MSTIHYQLYHDINCAAQRLAGKIVRTPLQLSQQLSQIYQTRIFLKREDLQIGGSYKIRGAFNRVALLGSNPSTHHIVTASTGNHAIAVVEAARQLGFTVTVFMPTTTPLTTRTRLRQNGGTAVAIRTLGLNLNAAIAAASTWAQQAGAVFIHPYGDDDVVVGQGTVAVEIIEQLAELSLKPNLVVVPLGGGGLVSGLGGYFQNFTCSPRIIGVQPASDAGLVASLNAGGRHPLAHVLTDRILAVTDQAVSRTMHMLLMQEGIQASAAGAVAASALPQLVRIIPGQTVVVIISGRQPVDGVVADSHGAPTVAV